MTVCVEKVERIGCKCENYHAYTAAPSKPPCYLVKKAVANVAILSSLIKKKYFQFINSIRRQRARVVNGYDSNYSIRLSYGFGRTGSSPVVVVFFLHLFSPHPKFFFHLVKYPPRRLVSQQ